MADNNLPLHIKQFNSKVRAMNQSSGKVLTLNAEEARSLHAEIYDLMATIASLTKNTSAEDAVVVNMDGGGFK